MKTSLPPKIKASVLVINAGSSSLKFSLFYITNKRINSTAFIKGLIDGIGREVSFIAQDDNKQILISKKWTAKASLSREKLLDFLLEWLKNQVGENNIIGAGHRVVHGGHIYNQPIITNKQHIAQLEKFIPLAPLHQPHNLAPISRLQTSNPQIPQVACFDTAFHRTQKWINTTYALPQAITDDGVCRYGFHGLSYEYVSSTLNKKYKKLGRAKVVICHLGNGSSLCALSSSKCVETSMGFSTLAGVPMGTRPGDIDAGILLYLMREKKMSLSKVENMLYKNSGLLGVSGISNDVRELSLSKNPDAKAAINLFCYRVAEKISALATALQGLDAIVFTAGIGENSPLIRKKVLRHLKWLGVKLNQKANQKGQELISKSSSKISVLILPTNEELMIAKHTFNLIKANT